ncbi:hypothetical protein WMF31_37560 [Sorangium sp. So ce1036]|uniref:ATP-binding protein n=1 Tax=Sorangium sp. So ce1036 TaxID=3133328 RepID=UPI003F007A22
MMESLTVLQRVTQDDLYEFIAEQCLPHLRDELSARGKARRLRVSDLPLPVMERLAQQLDGEGEKNKRWMARVLTAKPTPELWRATATKLIELRNVLTEPLIVFLPTGLRTAAEDSLDVATFTEIPIAPRTADFATELLKRLPSNLRIRVEDAFEFLRKEKVIRVPDAEVEYLLTVIKNGSTPQAAGGALCVFGLIPDFATFAGSDHRQRLSRNQNISALLADVRKPLQERIARLRVQANSVQKDLFVYLRNRHADETASWTSEIACDTKHRHLALEKWPFLDTLEGKEKLRLILDPLDLPVQTADEVGGATPMKVWDLKKEKTFKVSFSSIPAPALFEAWKSFRIQLLEINDGQPTPVWTSNNFPKPKTKAKTRKFSRQLKASDLETLAEGSYYLRIDALSQDGTVLTEIDTTSATQRAENESELFLLMRGDVPVASDQPRAVRTMSFSDAWCVVALKATEADKDGEPLPARAELTGAWDQPAGAAVRGDVTFTFDNPGANGLTIVLPGLLRQLEYEVLEHPEHMGMYRLELAGVRSLSDAKPKRRVTAPVPTDPTTQAFLVARKVVFDAILAQHARRKGEGDGDKRRRGTVETVDLLALRPLIESYAQAFGAWTRVALAADGPTSLRRLISSLDIAEVRWRPSGGDPGRALLVGPLHPLRLLWHLQHAVIVDQALIAWQAKTERAPSWREFLEQLRRGLLPANLPMVLFDDVGRGFVEREHVTQHWSLYLPDRAQDGERLDLGTCRVNARRHLGVRGRYLESAGLSARDLAVRVIEYIEQHPYVEQLRINVFNPGDGQLVADMLRGVEATRFMLPGALSQPPSLRYAVQMFAGADHVDETGEALDALLDPERQVAETDEFTLGSGNHLLPKLLVARSTVDEFLRNPGAFNAHITIFAEHFRAEARLSDVRLLRRGMFVAGLVEEPETRQIERPDGTGYGWTKGIHPKGAEHADTLERLLVETLATTQTMQAANAEGRAPPDGTAPTLTLRLESTDQALIRQVHDTSDWVLTIDRNLGLDYFDSSTSEHETGYLLDFSPEFLHEDQPRVMLTTRSAVELQNLVRPTLERFDLKLPEGGEVMVLETLRSLSGRFALRMLSGHSQAAEVVGLLVARWALERIGLLQRQIVIPIDAHRSWFTADNKDPLAVVKQRRADLLLLKLRPRERIIDVQVVEVKEREEILAKVRAQVYAGMHEQADNTVTRLRELFDQDLYAEPRADRLLRAKELANVLSFYLARAQRYALVSDSAAEEARTFIETLDSGYRLEFKMLGVLFEQRAKGYHVDEDEPGFPVHRIGGDIAVRLLQDSVAAFQKLRSETSSERPSHRSPPAPSPDLSRELEALRSQLGAEDEVPAMSVVTGAHSGPLEALGTAPRGGVDQVSSEPTVAVQVPAGDDTASTMPAPAAKTAAAPPRAAPAPAAPALLPEGLAHPGSVVMLGANERTQQFGVLGKTGGAKIAVDLNGCNTISLFGVQGFGKSYTMGVIAEMAVQPMPGINVLPAPLATVIFHYHKSDAYEPEFASAIQPNTKAREVERLLADYSAHPDGLKDIVLLVPEAKTEQRRREYPGIDVRPIKFASSELGADGWKFLMGAAGNDSLYVKQIVSIMQRCRGNLTLERLKAEIEDADLAKGLRKLAETRISLAASYIDDSARLGEVLRPGRTVIVDLRDEWLEQDDALGLFVVMMTIFGAVKYQGQIFNKLMVFDEAHKYITESELIGQVVGIIREMRHQATSVLIASQDPLSVPRAVIELTSLLILHRMTSPQWLKHLKSAIGALENLTEAQVGVLMAGEALVWAQRSTDARFSQRPQKIFIRPRMTQHGGGTKTAVAGATVR